MQRFFLWVRDAVTTPGIIPHVKNNKRHRLNAAVVFWPRGQLAPVTNEQLTNEALSFPHFFQKLAPSWNE